MLQVDERPAIEKTAPESGDAPGILLLQADSQLLRILASACEAAGLRVRACASIAQAREAYRQEPFGMVIVDWMVEGLFADEILALILGGAQLRPAPSVLVLSRLGEADTRECLRPDSPVQGVLTRPGGRAQFAEWAPRFAGVLKRTQTWMT